MSLIKQKSSSSFFSFEAQAPSSFNGGSLQYLFSNSSKGFSTMHGTLRVSIFFKIRIGAQDTECPHVNPPLNARRGDRLEKKKMKTEFKRQKNCKNITWKS